MRYIVRYGLCPHRPPNSVAAFAGHPRAASYWILIGRNRPSHSGMDMPQLTKPTLVYHADWGTKKEKRWCAKATPGHGWALHRRTLPSLVGNLGSLIEQLQQGGR